MPGPSEEAVTLDQSQGQGSGPHVRRLVTYRGIKQISKYIEGNESQDSHC